MDSTFPANRRRSPGAKSTTTCLGLLVPLLSLSPPAWSAAEPARATKPAPFGPGIRIDWKKRLVEVDAEVVLRKGSLELLVCSPQTREHESILRIHAKPLHVYQAMGLIGLTPGSPMKFDDRSKQWHRPTGDSLMLSVRYPAKGGTSEVPVERWLRDVEHKQIPRPIDWVFAGSRTLENGKFGADLDGTVVCVVDFDTALIAVSDLHTADNEDLWLEANTEVIPPVGTRCTLVIQAAPRPVPIVRMSVDGSLRHGGKPITIAVMARLAAESWAKREGPAVILEIDDGASQADRAIVFGALARVGIARDRVDVRMAKPKSRHPKAGFEPGG